MRRERGEGEATSVGVTISDNNKESPVDGRNISLSGGATYSHHHREFQDVTDPRGGLIFLRLQESQKFIQLRRGG